MTSSIRPATETDIPALIDMGSRFHRAADLCGAFSPPSFAGYCGYLMREENGCVFRSPCGMIGGYISSAPWDSTYKIANETFWWSEDSMGASLLRAYEEWADERADEVRMGFLINMRPAATGRVLGKMGYMGLEMIMVKQ